MLPCRMSIALSAVVRPSRWLNLGFHAMLFAITVVAVGIALGLCGNLPLLARALISAVCLISVLFALFHDGTRKKAYLIDIAPSGEIRLMPGRLDVFRGDAPNPAVAVEPDRVRLMAGSTLWPALICLHLQSLTGGRRYQIVILPDSLADASEFRALLVALRWIAGRGMGGGEDPLCMDESRHADRR